MVGPEPAGRDDSVWSPRNVFAIAAIFSLATIVIAVTAIVTRQGGHSTSSKATSTPPPPRIEEFLLDSDTIGNLMGNVPLKANPPWEGLWLPVALTPPECRAAANFADAELYAVVDWKAAHINGYAQDDKKMPQMAMEAIVRVPSADDAISLLQHVVGDWEQCSGKTYTFTSEQGAWTMQRVQNKGDTVVAVSKEPEDPNWSCEHVMAINSIYVAEVQVCGVGSGQAEKIAEGILEKTKR